MFVTTTHPVTFVKRVFSGESGHYPTGTVVEVVGVVDDMFRVRFSGGEETTVPTGDVKGGK